MNTSQNPAQPILYQTWRNLLFLHWQIAAEQIQARLPPGLRVDTYEGNAYLGIVPFYMDGLRPRQGPACPGISSFPELNLRTYVCDDQGNRGVWFFSLDAHTRISVAIARTFFNLPYRYSKMAYHVSEDRTVQIQASRPNEPVQRFIYRPTTKLGTSAKASLSEFLVERYKLFAYSRKGVLSMGTIRHPPYELYEVDLAAYSTALFKINGFSAPKEPPTHAVFSKGVTVDVLPMKRVG